MTEVRGNVIVGQSGGPTAVINSSLAGVFKTAKDRGAKKVYGMLHGIQGLLQERYVDLEEHIKSDLDIELLKRTPSAYLGSCRFKLPEICDDREIYDKIFSILDKLEVEYFFYIGGNDSMDTVDKLSRHFSRTGQDIKVIGIPKTIDNDLPGSDHSPGFGSSAKFIATAMLEIIRDCYVYDTDSVTIVEIMGRHAGWLTASAALPRTVGARAPHLIYLPEVAFDPEQFIRDVKQVQSLTRNCIVAVSEGVRLADGTFAAENFQSGVVDAFGHRYLSGVGKYLESLVREKIGCKVRSIELNVLQRCSSHLMSATDVREARKIGSYAIRFALQGHTGVMMVFERVSNRPYMVRIGCKPVSEIANREQLVPREWINKQGNDVTDEMFEYLLPLIEGEVPYPTQNGMPVHFVLNQSIVE